MSNMISEFKGRSHGYLSNFHCGVHCKVPCDWYGEGEIEQFLAAHTGVNEHGHHGHVPERQCDLPAAAGRCLHQLPKLRGRETHRNAVLLVG